MKQEIIVLIGTSGSGKSTYARKLAREKGYIRLNRDEMRMMLYGYTEEDLHEYYQHNIRYHESFIDELYLQMIEDAIQQGKSIVADATHLKKKYIKNYFYYGVDVRLILIDTPVEVALARDNKRKASVGKEVIEKQTRLLHSLKNSLIFVEDKNNSDEERRWFCTKVKV